MGVGRVFPDIQNLTPEKFRRVQEENLERIKVLESGLGDANQWVAVEIELLRRENSLLSLIASRLSRDDYGSDEAEALNRAP